jgi:hypothetical protein
VSPFRHYNAIGEIEPGAVYLQVKATDRLPRVAGGKSISWPVSRRDLKLWLDEAYPVILVVYDGPKDKGYWLYIQAYVSASRTAELFTGGETIHFHIPIANRLNQRAIRAIAQTKNEVHQQLRRKGPQHG